MAAAIAAGTACMPAEPGAGHSTRPSSTSARPTLPARPASHRAAGLPERAVDGVTLLPARACSSTACPSSTRSPRRRDTGTREVWQFINLTVDAHPMHPHLVKHQIVAAARRSTWARYKTHLCGARTCKPGPGPGNEMQVVPDVNARSWAPVPQAPAVPVTAASVEGGWKDAVQAPPGMVTTIVADWTPRWNAGVARQNPVGAPNAPGARATGSHLRWTAPRLRLRGRDRRPVRVALPHQLARGLGDDAHQPRGAVAG